MSRSSSRAFEITSADVIQKKSKFEILIARHGERVDFLYFDKNKPETYDWVTGWVKKCFIDGKYVRCDLNLPVELPMRDGFPDSFINDTPLSNVGALQAKQTGVGFAEANVHVKYVYCSPALRSLETCHNILIGMGISEEVQIRIEPALFEFLYFYKDNWPKFMLDDELISAGYNIDKSYIPMMSRDDLKKLVDTENIEEYYQRSYAVVQKFIATAKKEGKGHILIVAHGYTLDTCTRQLIGEEPRSQDELLGLPIPYCSVVRCHKKEKAWKLGASPAPGLKISENDRFDYEKVLLS